MNFLEYSLKEQKKIKAVLLQNGTILQMNIQVMRFKKDGFYYTTSKQKKEQYCPFSDVLATAYARGDMEGK